RTPIEAVANTQDVVIAQFLGELRDELLGVGLVCPVEQRLLFCADPRLSLIRGVPVAAAVVIDVLPPGPPVALLPVPEPPRGGVAGHADVDEVPVTVEIPVHVGVLVRRRADVEDLPVP